MTQENQLIYDNLLIGVYTMIALGSLQLILSLMALAELRSGKHRLKLRYSRMLPTPFQETDSQAVFEMYLIVISEALLLAYLVLLCIRLGQGNFSTLSTNYIMLCQSLSLFFLTCGLLSELKQWFKQNLRLHSANKLIGEPQYTVELMQNLQYFSFFYALIIFGYFVIIGYSCKNESDVQNDQVVQLIQMNFLSNIGVATVFLAISGCYIFLGYQIWNQSSKKYGHDVEDMRQNIKKATLAVACTCICSAFFFYLQSILQSSIDTMIDKMLKGNDNVFEMLFPLQLFAGLVIVQGGLTVGIYHRIVSGWDRINLLPLSMPVVEQDMLLQLQKEFKDNEIGESLLDGSFIPDNMHKMDAGNDKFDYSSYGDNSHLRGDNSRISAVGISVIRGAGTRETNVSLGGISVIRGMQQLSNYTGSPIKERRTIPGKYQEAVDGPMTEGSAGSLGLKEPLTPALKKADPRLSMRPPQMKNDHFNFSKDQDQFAFSDKAREDDFANSPFSDLSSKEFDPQKSNGKLVYPSKRNSLDAADISGGKAGMNEQGLKTVDQLHNLSSNISAQFDINITANNPNNSQN